MSFNPYREYQAAAVTGRSAVELVVMLFEGLVRFLEQAKGRIQAKDVEGAHELLSKARKIVMHLITTVNDRDGGEAAQRLKALYLFCVERIVMANFKKNSEHIDEALRVIVILQETWAELEARERPKREPVQTQQQAHAVA